MVGSEADAPTAARTPGTADAPVVVKTLSLVR